MVVLGAGPAGLVCAGELAELGCEVTIYEARPEPGGLARYAIAPFRQLNDPLPAEARLVADAGAQLRFGHAVESAAALREIEARADAIFPAVGMGPDLDLRYPGDNLRGVWSSLPVIEAVKSHGVDVACAAQARRVHPDGASLAAVIGASWAGAKAMPATSGPGFSLMQENHGYLGAGP